MIEKREERREGILQRLSLICVETDLLILEQDVIFGQVLQVPAVCLGQLGWGRPLWSGLYLTRSANIKLEMSSLGEVVCTY